MNFVSPPCYRHQPMTKPKTSKRPTRARSSATSETPPPEALTRSPDDLIAALTDIVRWATANLSPEFIRDTPVASYRRAALYLDDWHPDKALARELMITFADRADLADAWAARRGLADATAAAAADESPFPVTVAAGFSRKAIGNAGVFEGAASVGWLRRTWRRLFG